MASPLLRDPRFEITVGIVLLVPTMIVVYPLYFILIASISDPALVATGQIVFFPRGITFEGLERILQYDRIWLGYRNTILYTAAGALFSTTVTVLAAFALSRRHLYGKRLISIFFIIPMFFQGGLIPTYLVARTLGINNSVWAIVLIGSVQIWNLIITRTYFQTSIPYELYESAQMDGCSDPRFFGSIVLPLSKPIIAVMLLFFAVWQWNDFFRALVYLRDRQLHPLQLVLRDILLVTQTDSFDMGDIEDMLRRQALRESVKYGVIIVATLPLLVAYPFVQKYFVKGVMIGSLKG